MRNSKSTRVVEVVPFDTSWRSMFLDEERRLLHALKGEPLEVHHIGSTAIPGMRAKPVIDILVVVRNIEKVDSFNSSMSAIGYEAMGEYGIRGRRFLIKDGDRRSHHVHVFQKGSDEIERHLNFRDFMIAHPREAARYATLKRSLAARFESDIDSYCDGKDSFIREMNEKAALWAGARNMPQRRRGRSG